MYSTTVGFHTPPARHAALPFFQYFTSTLPHGENCRQTHTQPQTSLPMLALWQLVYKPILPRQIDHLSVVF